MKKFLNFLSKFALSILVVGYLVFAPNFVLKKTILKQDALINTNKSTYYGVVDMWHIESFEGGSASRSSWLEKRAQEFEKQNKGVFIAISTMTQETAKLNIKNGKLPKLISFSLGMGDCLTNSLLEYKGKKVGLEKLLLAGKINKKQLAVPYMLGGYCGFNINKGEILSGLSVNNLSAFAAACMSNDGICSSKISDLSFNLDSYNAYVSFVKGNANSLIGTQRDFYRLNNRINNGSMPEGEFTFLGFSDLVQYAGICNVVNENEYSVCQNFIEYLTNETSQNTLNNINMFSVFDSEGAGGNKLFNNFQNTVKNNLKTVNVFLQAQDIKNIQEVSKKFLKGEEQSIKSLFKYII